MAKVRDILVFPDARLRRTSVPLAPGPQPESIRELAADLAVTMRAARGLGISAPQVGVPVCLIVIDGELATGMNAEVRRATGLEVNVAAPLILVNPELVYGPDSETSDEGCLSFPQIFVQVRRHRTVRLRALDIDGRQIEREAAGLFARALQHECDHLTGRLLIDNVGAARRDIIRRQLRKWREART